MAAADYSPGAQVVRSKYNFVAAFNLHKPDVDPELALVRGSQSLVGLMEYVGNKKMTESLEYIHHEEDWIMPKIKATTAGAGAGVAATFTLASDALDTVNFNNSPYNSTVTESLIPVRVNDVILIKPGSGVVSASTYIRAFVTSVNAGAGTFVAAPSDPTDSIPAIGTADEIVVFTNVFGEDSGQPKSRNSRTFEFKNQLQIVKETHKVTGTEENIVLWTWVTGPNGERAPYWRIKGEGDTWKRFENYKELGLLNMEEITNPVIVDAQATADTPIVATEGLIPFILSQGNTSNYSGITGWTLSDAEVLAKVLDKQKGSKYNLMKVGFDLGAQIDRELGDRFKDGGVSYGNFRFDDDKRVALEFDTFSIAGYQYMKRVYDVFNDNQTLGSAGYTYVDEAMVIPMDNRVISFNGDSNEVPSLRIRYMEGRDPKVSYVDRFDVDGFDRMEVNYLGQCGFEGTGGNRYAYVKRAS